MLGKYTFCHMESDMGPAVHLDAFLPSTFQPAFRSSGATVWSPGVQAAGGAKTHRGARWLKLYGIIYLYIYMLYIYRITRCVFENKISACIHVQAAMHATLIYANHLIEWHWSHSHTFTFWFYDSVVSWSLLTFLPVPHNVNCWRRALIKIKNHWRTTEPAPPDLCICPMHLKKSPVNDYPAPSRLLWYVHRLLGSYLSLW